MKEEELRRNVVYAWLYSGNHKGLYLGTVLRNYDASLGVHISLGNKQLHNPKGVSGWGIGAGMSSCRIATIDEIRIYNMSIYAKEVVFSAPIDNLEIF